MDGQHLFTPHLCPSPLLQIEWNREGDPGDAAVLAQVAWGRGGAPLTGLSDVSKHKCDLGWGDGSAFGRTICPPKGYEFDPWPSSKEV